MPKGLQVLLLVVLTLLAASARGQSETASRDRTDAALMLTDSAQVIDASRHVIVLEDADGGLTFDQARERLVREGQRPQGRGLPTFGYTQSAYWLQLDIDNTFEETRVWVARFRLAILDRVDLYYQDNSGDWQQKSAGHALPFAERDLAHPMPNFTFPVLPDQPRTLFFRVENSGSVQIPLQLMSLDNYQSHGHLDQLLQGIFYGVLLILVSYCLFMWYSSRDWSYLYFGLFILFGASYSFIFHGMAFQFLWPESPRWANYSLVLATGLAALSGLLFVREFLAVRDMERYWELVTRGMLAVLLTATYVSAFVPLHLATRSLFWTTAMTVVLVTGIAIRGLRDGQRAAYYFCGAWVVLLTGILIEMGQRVGLAMPPVLAYHSVQAGTVIGAVILSLGLSDRVSHLMERYQMAQKEMIKANQLKLNALQRADSIKEEFIANVSHELRTPLTGIIGLAEIMLDDRSSPLRSSDRETLQLMKVSAQRLSTLVNDVIDFATIKKGHLELQKKDVDLKEVCRIVARMTRPLVGDKPIDLREEYPPERVIVEADEDRLQQVLFNLVSNAVKFTRHGAVTIRLEVVDIDARVTVQDTGIGISDEEQRKIFNRFYQVDSADTRQSGGTGLGLAISQKLLELHDAEIILHSEPGRGSLFYFDLTLKQSVPDANGSQPSGEVKEIGTEENRLARLLGSASPLVERRREEHGGGTLADVHSRGQEGSAGLVLVVDDEYLNLRIVESHLSEHYELLTASSGADALELLSERRPDLIILDVMMPVMTGVQLCQVIRKRYGMDELPIIMLTAKNRVEDLVKGLNAGANDYITKPFSREELVVRVSKQFELMELQRVRQENQRLNWQLQRYEDMQQRLRERERRLARMLDVTGDAMLCVDEGGDIFYVNNVAEDLLGVSAADYTGGAFNDFLVRLKDIAPALGESLHFPFSEALISSQEEMRYQRFTLTAAGGEPVEGRFCLMAVSMDEEFYLLVLEQGDGSMAGEEEADLDRASLPELIAEFTRNVERTRMLSEYLGRIEPDDLKKHQELFSDLKQVDHVIRNLSGSIPHKDDDLRYREVLVKLMQDCHFYWQKVTGESVIDLAEKSRIWSVSVDNGRLRTRSMNRYLSLEKLPSNPRWRQVARTAYFVLSKVSHDPEARDALEQSVARLQEIVEERALG
ncbi:MAG: 7TM diverse intracellular signaling domain-containing protein [Pseudohongiellaceae bacterium]